LGALVFAADHRPDGESGSEEILGHGAASIAGTGGDEDCGLCFGHLKTPEIMRFFFCCFIL
jgi:hypothetical protein